MMSTMNLPVKRRVRSRLAVGWLVALSFFAPVLAGSGAARADDLKNDARLEGYKGTVVLDIGVAPYFLLMAVLAVLGISVLFKDAKRSYSKK
jgi:hypothetical protein